MSLPPGIDIWPAAEVFDPSDDTCPGQVGDLLEPLAGKIFGHTSTRTPGWLRRKCLREGVDPPLSQVAIDTSGEPPSKRQALPQHLLLGYFLIGRRPRTPHTGFTAGLGVAPEARGLGVGKALLQAGHHQAVAAGLTQLVLPAPGRQLAFYRHHGYRQFQCIHTWLAFAHGPGRPATTGTTWEVAPGVDAPQIELCAWSADVWERMPPNQRLGFALAGPRPRTARETTREENPGLLDTQLRGWALCSREGRAVLCHRLVSRPEVDPHELTSLLLQAISPGTPVLLYGVPQVSSFTEILQDSCWSSVQTCHLMVKDLRS